MLLHMLMNDELALQKHSRGSHTLFSNFRPLNHTSLPVPVGNDCAMLSSASYVCNLKWHMHDCVTNPYELHNNNAH